VVISGKVYARGSGGVNGGMGRLIKRNCGEVGPFDRSAYIETLDIRSEPILL